MRRAWMKREREGIPICIANLGRSEQKGRSPPTGNLSEEARSLPLTDEDPSEDDAWSDETRLDVQSITDVKTRSRYGTGCEFRQSHVFLEPRELPHDTKPGHGPVAGTVLCFPQSQLLARDFILPYSR
jgi:hypothetical protein